jgi:hypothetical protein
VASNGITFIPNFENIDHVVQKIKGGTNSLEAILQAYFIP